MRFIATCLLLALCMPAPALADTEESSSFTQRILEQLRTLRIKQEYQAPAAQWQANPAPVIRLHSTAYADQFPMLQDAGAPLGDTAINYRMQLGSRQVGLELRYEF